MLKLMKYEFRKTMFSKLIILIITALAEAAYLLGVFLKWNNGLAWGLVGLSLCAVIGIAYIGIDSLLVFQKDLNTKQSYMLFLTPQSSYQILGAKVIENGLSIFLAGAFYAALAALDFTVGVLYIGGVKGFLDVIRDLSVQIRLDISITPESVLLVFFTILASWLMMIVIGYMAILLSATVFAGKRFSGLVSFLIYLLITWAANAVINLVPDVANEMQQYCLVIGAALVVTAVIYVAAGWIMEHKLSV